MTTLRQRCIQVLRNNVDVLFRAGRVPSSVLEPVLESCTPDQLHRLETYNRALAEETHQLWKMHCHRNFKKEKREERESWREMYLRLQDAREQRLRALTLKIRSAQASGPKGRQAKMIFFHSFERGGAAGQEKVKIMAALTPTTSGHAPSQGAGGHSFLRVPGKPAGDSTSSTRARLAQVASSSKKPAKLIAPMMAKTTRDFRNRFSRR